MPEAPTRVFLCGNHPWAGETGVVIGEDNIGMKVRLDHIGQEVYVFPGQWRGLSNG